MADPGITTLRKVQLGRESTAGNAVAATTIGRWDNVAPSDESVYNQIAENIGLAVDSDRMNKSASKAAISVPENDATFEQLLHILEMGIKTDTPAQDGAGDGYIYEYPFPIDDPQTLKTYTIEIGDNNKVREAEYCFASAFTLSGAVEENLKLTADIVGRQFLSSSFTGALSVPSVEEMKFQKCKLYISDVGDGFGNDLFSNTLLGFNFSYNTGFAPRPTGDGNLYFSYAKYTKAVASLELKLEHNDSAEAEIADGEALTARAVRIICEGSTFSTPGTMYSKKTFILDLAGKYSMIPSIEDDGGSSILNFTLQGGYNSTLAQMGKITVVTDLASIP